MLSLGDETNSLCYDLGYYNGNVGDIVWFYPDESSGMNKGNGQVVHLTDMSPQQICQPLNRKLYRVRITTKGNFGGDYFGIQILTRTECIR